MKLRHPNVVSFIGVSSKDGFPCLVTEFCEGGDLFGLLQKKRHIDIPWQTRVAFALDIASGMLYLHSLHPPVLHRDLKSPNILLDQEYSNSKSRTRLKIVDFGLSRLVNPLETEKLSGGIGTCRWMAPEMVEALPYTKKADVYSYGIILWEIIMRDVPYRHLNSRFAILQYVMEGGKPDVENIPEECPQLLKDLMIQCLEREPEKRPDFDKIVATLLSIQKH
eukprot:TRINITY_DN10688_c0_g1_i3.p1 TRINITY_DN10688_c0_g1~~TRINITY_DN10688_c0_g1_i3.p1  ORF type:complete len:222 (-),score=33.53 TRINITY_DN10688_c0_g1_i3:100-765(-)